MTFRIEGTAIYLTRGDTLAATVGIKNASGSAYALQTGDVVRFALKRALMAPGNGNYLDKKPLISKTLGDDLQLELDPEDTKSLAFGSYKYDLELTKANGVVDTFINNADFYIVPEVT